MSPDFFCFYLRKTPERIDYFLTSIPFLPISHRPIPDGPLGSSYLRSHSHRGQQWPPPCRIPRSVLTFILSWPVGIGHSWSLPSLCYTLFTWFPWHYLSGSSSSTARDTFFCPWWFPTISWSLNIKALRAQSLGLTSSPSKLTPKVTLYTVCRRVTPRLVSLLDSSPKFFVPGLQPFVPRPSWASSEHCTAGAEKPLWRTGLSVHLLKKLFLEFT